MDPLVHFVPSLGGTVNPAARTVATANKETFHKLVTALRTAVANEYKLDKEVSIFNDILDAFRMALTFYKRTK